ncbi:MAG: hypothetical protein H6841_06605 [Planctomycetes bacterium]|nr:hypothetical protein [Planctomycetota bacterium]MCB9936217.1 hypothetical protein [Planctomycetota bacterium]
MPIPRILAAAVGALVLLLATLWCLDVNYAAWLGAWLAPENQYVSGLGVLVSFGFVAAFAYARWFGNMLPGAGPIRGLIFGAILAAGAIWILPAVLNGVAGIVGNTQVVFQGHGITNDQETFNEKMARTRVEPCPEIGGQKPPLAHLTKDHPWAPADGWIGRLLPFSVGFLLYGLVIGVFLSDEKRGAS